MIATLVDATTNQDLAVNSAQVLHVSGFTDKSCRVYFIQQHAVLVQGSVEEVMPQRETENARKHLCSGRRDFQFERLFSATRRNWPISHTEERLFRFRYSRQGGHLMSS